jgi:lysophospholipase L1-like esterase
MILWSHSIFAIMRKNLLALLATVCSLSAAQPSPTWVGSWAASQQLPEPQNSLPPDDLRDATLRQLIHLSVGGTTLRVHLSNAFGTSPLHLSSVHIARPVSASSAAIDPASDKALSFHGAGGVTIPAGAEFLSDPLDYPTAPLSNLAVSIHFDDPPAQQTGHPGSRATSYLAHGDLVSAPDLANAKKVAHWYQLSGVDVSAGSAAAAIVALGDSITDGHGATTDANDRWTDVLARRLQAASPNLSVLNQGIGGNHLLTDGNGPNALARFDRDVLAQAGVRYVIVLEGVNDLGGLTRDHEVSPADHAAFVQRILAVYEQIIAQARTHGIMAIGATILPYKGSGYYHPGRANEGDRKAVNDWIRVPGHFDAVVDFDHVMRDPAQPDQMLPAYDSGDHLHPSPAGYAAMANAIPLSLFAFDSGPAPQIAFTFDDLPAHSALPPGETRLEVASKLIAALEAAHVQPIYGFVNGVRTEEHPRDVSVLEAWRQAGNPLGNHGWSHMNLNQHTLEDFELDVSKNEPLLSQWMEGQDWHWFRFPFLAEGDTSEKKAAIRTFLLQHGYKIAGVTMSFGDYRWNEPYARCKAKGDAKGIQSLEQSKSRNAEHDNQPLSRGINSIPTVQAQGRFWIAGVLFDDERPGLTLPEKYLK